MARTIFILDPNLKNLLGHYFEYDRSLAEAAARKGLACSILSHRDVALPPGLPIAVHPVYSADIWQTVRGENYHSKDNIVASSAAFSAETLKFFTEIPASTGDIVFLPSVTKAQLPGAVALAEALGPSGIELHIMLRYQRSFYEGATAESAFLRLESLAETMTIKFSTDSHRLANALSSLTSLAIGLLPIPHTDRLASQSSPHSSRDPFHFVCLGNARGEKGLAEILDSVRKSASMPWSKRVRFTLQCNDPSDDIADAVATFRTKPDPRVTLIDHVLDSDNYYAILNDADAVLLPYHRDIYKDRTSGVFLEALMAGKIILCTNDTWMSDVLEVHGSGQAVVDRSSTDLCSAIGKIALGPSEFDERARRAAAYWRTIHTADNLVEHLLGNASNSAALPHVRRAAVIYPWEDVVNGNSGAISRTRLFIKYIEPHYDQIRILFPGNPAAREKLTAKTVAEPYKHWTLCSLLLYALTELLTRFVLFTGNGSGFHLWYHLWPRLDFRFHRRCKNLVCWADDVFLDYSYFAPVVAPYCRQFGKSLILTQYDIVSEQSKGKPLIYPAVRWLEFQALRSAERVIVSTEKDRALCEAQQIRAEVIPHPIDVDAPDMADEDAILILENLYHIPMEGRRICFFVGSNYGPNRKAAASIRSMARSLKENHAAKSLIFVVAGACMAPERDDNFFALGPIVQAGLSALYKKTAIVLVPLTEGSGSSIKSIEALAHGVVLLSTSIGVRGIGAVHNEHCVIEDDLSAYPNRILEILQDQNRANHLRMGGQKFASSFDYRAVFAAYGLPLRRAQKISIGQGPLKRNFQKNTSLVDKSLGKITALRRRLARLSNFLIRMKPHTRIL